MVAKAARMWLDEGRVGDVVLTRIKMVANEDMFTKTEEESKASTYS